MNMKWRDDFSLFFICQKCGRIIPKWRLFLELDLDGTPRCPYCGGKLFEEGLI